MEDLGQSSKGMLAWRTSSACPNNATCVEIAVLPNGGAAMRDNKDPQSPELRFSAVEWAAFVAGVKRGEY